MAPTYKNEIHNNLCIEEKCTLLTFDLLDKYDTLVTKHEIFQVEDMSLANR